MWNLKNETKEQHYNKTKTDSQVQKTDVWFCDYKISLILMLPLNGLRFFLPSNYSLFIESLNFV